MIQNFPKLFSGLGILGEKYCIQLKDDVVPYSLYTPRNVAIPLQEKKPRTQAAWGRGKRPGIHCLRMRE